MTFSCMYKMYVDHIYFHILCCPQPPHPMHPIILLPEGHPFYFFLYLLCLMVHSVNFFRLTYIRGVKVHLWEHALLTSE